MGLWEFECRMVDEGAGARNNGGGFSTSERRIPGQPRYEWGPGGVAAGMLLDFDGTQLLTNVYQTYANRVRAIEDLIATLQLDFEALGLPTSFLAFSMPPGSSSAQVYGFGALSEVPEIKTYVVHLLRIISNAQTTRLSKLALREVCCGFRFFWISLVLLNSYNISNLVSLYPLF